MKNKRWPIIIASLLTLHVAASMFFVYLATSNESFAVEEDYYQKALDWDEKRAQDSANQRLGWQLQSKLVDGAAAASGATLQVSLVNAGGEAIDNATVDVEAFPIARADQIVRRSLRHGGAGGYETELPMGRQGRWELRFVATRGDERFTHVDTHYLLRLPRETDAE